jgi:hypothetical protein
MDSYFSEREYLDAALARIQELAKENKLMRKALLPVYKNTAALNHLDRKQVEDIELALGIPPQQPGLRFLFGANT